MYLQLLTFPAYYSYHKKYVFKTSSSLIFNPTKAKIDTLIEKYKIKNILKNKMVAWNVIFTHKKKIPFWIASAIQTLSYLQLRMQSCAQWS